MMTPPSSPVPSGPMTPAQAGMSRLGAAGIGSNGNPSMDTGKLPMTVVHYRQSTQPGVACRSCEFADQQGGCAKVAGQIKPDGVCDLFDPMEPAGEPASEVGEAVGPGGVR